MRATKLTIRNIGIIADVAIDINKPLLVFYGDVMQGKSTILHSLQWCMGGAFPDDIIRHGQEEAFIQFEAVESGKPVVIRREWYRAKDQTTKARAIQMTRNGVLVKKPSDEIAKFLNPFLFDQDHLRNMSDLERQRFLVELFGVDTAAEDQEIAEAARAAAELRAKVKGYGSIDTTKVEAVDCQEIRERLQQVRDEHAKKVSASREGLREIQAKHQDAVDAINAENARIAKDNASVEHVKTVLASGQSRERELRREIEALQRELEEIVSNNTENGAWLAHNPSQALKPSPKMRDVSELQAIIDTPCDTAALEAMLSEAGAKNVRHQQYLANLTRAKAKAADEQKVLDLERKQRDLKEAKVAKLAGISGTCGVPGLEFAGDGSFAFEDVSAGMLSDSQLMRLSQLLSAKYPEGFGLALIDRGESLGKSVLELWKHAQECERSILVTVVGDKPAAIPAQVGAFVVDAGKVRN